MFGSTRVDHSLAFKTCSFALAGSIPTEFGKHISMKYLRLYDNKLSGTPPFAHVACHTTCFKNVLICAGRVDPHGIRQAHQPESPRSRRQQIDRYAPFAHVAWFGGTTCFTTSSFGLAGSIPTEFGELINLTDLHLRDNTLSGKPSFANFTWFGSTSLPLALKTSSFALAGSIPAEFGELINLTDLDLQYNKLSGTPSLFYVVWSTSQPLAISSELLHYELVVVEVQAVVVPVQVVLQVMVQAKT
jgi:hypothetical protein